MLSNVEESFQEAEEKLKIALEDSEVEEKFSEMQDKSLRNYRHKKKIETSSSDDDRAKQDAGSKLAADFPEPPGCINHIY